MNGGNWWAREKLPNQKHKRKKRVAIALSIVRGRLLADELPAIWKRKEKRGTRDPEPKTNRGRENKRCGDPRSSCRVREKQPEKGMLLLW